MIVRQSTAGSITVGPVLDANGEFVTDCVIGDFKISKNGAAPAALNGSATLTHRHTGHFSLTWTTSDVDTVGTVDIVIDDTVNACAPVRLQVVEEAIYDALFAASATGLLPANVTQISGDSGAADNLELAYDGTGYDVGGIDVSELNQIVDDLLNGGRLDLLVDAIKAKTDNLAFTTAGKVDARVDYVGTNAVTSPDDFKATSVTVSDKTGFSLAADQSGVTIGTVNAMAGTIATLDALDAAQDSQHSTTQSAIGALNNIAATDIVSAGPITTLSGAVVNVDTVDTCTTNTDMRGTDNALLAASTPANFAALGINVSGHVSRVTLVDTTTTNTDMRGTDGANTTTPPSVSAIRTEIDSNSTQLAAILQDTGTTLPAQITLAQNDLDILTGTDGVTLATVQDNYTPAKAGDQMDLIDAPNATAVTAIQNGLALASKLLNYVRLLARKDSAVSTDLATELGEINADTGTGTGTYSNNDSQESIRDNASAPTVTEIRQEMDSNSTRLSAIVGYFSGITSLAAWLGALAGKTADSSTLTEIQSTTAGATYDNASDSLQALRDRGDVAWSGAGGSVNITPLSAGVEQRVNGTNITLYLNEVKATTISITDAAGTAIDLSALTLELAIEDHAGTDIQVIADADITISGDSSNNATFTNTAAVTASERVLHWALRDITTGSEVLARGLINVKRAADGD